MYEKKEESIKDFYFDCQYSQQKILSIVDKKFTKRLSNFENKQPDCTILFIFVYELAFIGCILSKL